MSIRVLEPADVCAAADLLRRSALAFILHESTPAGAAAFLAQQDAAAIRRNLDAGYVYHAAHVDGRLAGFIGLRGSHVYHLFVDAVFQRRGIARALWQTARAAARAEAYTVNASNAALPFYLGLGFERTAPMQVADVLYNPMRLVDANSARGAALVGAA